MLSEYPEGYIPEACPVLREKYSDRLARIEEKLEIVMYEIRKAKVDKYVFGLICSMCSAAFASLVTYVLK